jgi:hypothetical protein
VWGVGFRLYESPFPPAPHRRRRQPSIDEDLRLRVARVGLVSDANGEGGGGPLLVVLLSC